MNDQHWLFVVLIVVLMISPGPAVVLAITNGLLHGVRDAIKAILGNVTGVAVMSFVGVMGVGMILSYSDVVYGVIKWVGGAYLGFLGVKMWRTQRERVGVGQQAQEVRHLSGWQLYRQGLLVTLSNPKFIAFVIAVFPQFIAPNKPLLPQYVYLTSTTIFFQFSVGVAYAYLASQIRQWLNVPGRLNVFGKLSGLTFMGFAVALVFSGSN